MTHRTFGRQGRVARGRSLEDLRGTAIPDSFVDAAKAASDAFRKAGVRHTLVGGMAVGVHGYARHTKDVDFMVGEEAFEHHGHIVSPKAGLPIRFNDIDVDWVSLDEHERAVLDEFLEEPAHGEVPVVPTKALIYMKLLAGRQRDYGDVVELLKAGADVTEAIEFVHSNGTRAMLTKLEGLTTKAKEETD